MLKWEKKCGRVKEILENVETLLPAAKSCHKDEGFVGLPAADWDVLKNYIKSLEDYLDRTQDDATWGTGGWRQYALEEA